MQFPSRRTNSPGKEWNYSSVGRKNSPGAIFPSDGRIDFTIKKCVAVYISPPKADFYPTYSAGLLISVFESIAIVAPLAILSIGSVSALLKKRVSEGYRNGIDRYSDTYTSSVLIIQSLVYKI
jgi:hypothetical protein